MSIFDEINIPNLDGMNITELNALSIAFKDLSKIAEMMAKAIIYRQGGDIQQALRLERKVDKLHKELPQQIKW